jgi:hypothetical protein
MGNAIAAGISDGMRQAELGKLCMQARGYTLQAANAGGGGFPSAPPPPLPERRSIKPADAIAEAKRQPVGKKFADLRFVAAQSAAGDPTDVVCGRVDGKLLVYMVDERQALVVEADDTSPNRGMYRHYCENAVARR